VIEVFDKRNCETVPLGQLNPGDTFMMEKQLGIVIAPSHGTRVSIVLLGGVRSGNVNYFEPSVMVQQVSLTISVHLV